MTPEETGRLLGICAAYDNRNVDESSLYAWYRVVGDLPYGACETAVINHYSNSREWIMPADIRGRVKREQRDLADRGRVRELLDPDTYRAQVAAADGAFMRKLAAKTGGAAIKAAPEADYGTPDEGGR
jgi:hypothetical protein